MQLEIINPLEDHRWDDFINHHDRSTFFHQTSWARVLFQTYGFTPCYLANCSADGKIASGCPFFLVSNFMLRQRLIGLPYTDYCWPLGQHDWWRLKDIYPLIDPHGNAISVEVRGGAGFPDMIKHDYYKRFTIDLSAGVGEVWRRLSVKSIRYSIKRAEREHISIIQGNSERERELFYHMNVITRRHHGIIPQPRRFFQNLFNEITNRKNGFLLLAQKGRTITAGSVFLLHKGVIYLKYNASEPRYRYLCSNHLILWHAIKWAIERGLKTMDLGRTAPDNAGLMSYKRHWGAVETDLPYYYFPDIQGISAGRETDLKYRGIRKIIEHTPSMILKKIGDRCYRYIA